MATIRIKDGFFPLYLTASTIPGILSDRFFTTDNREFEFTDEEAVILLASCRADGFDKVVDKKADKKPLVATVSAPAPA